MTDVSHEYFTLKDTNAETETEDDNRKEVAVEAKNTVLPIYKRPLKKYYFL